MAAVALAQTYSDGPPLSLRNRLNRRWTALKNERTMWDPHIRDIADHFRPRRTRFFPTERTGKNPANSYVKIIDNTGPMSANILRSGLVNGLSNPTQKWFKYEPEDLELLEYGPVKEWLGLLERLVYRIFQASNFYESITLVYDEVALFATAAAIIDDDFEDVIRLNAFTFGAYCLGVNARRVVDTLYRETSMTVLQTVQMFGLKNVSKTVERIYDNSNYDELVPVMHAIEPNVDRDPSRRDNRNMPWRSVYWEPACSEKDKFLRRSGYRANPIIGPRWNVIDNDVYGSDCPGMVALGDVRQLQIQQKRKGQAIEKLVNPPTQGPASLADRFIQTLPGQHNVVSDMSSGGIKPLYEVKPQLGDMNEDIGDTRNRVERSFFVPWILAISSMEGVQPKNQMEIMERKGEGLAMLGPAIGRIQSEALSPVHNRVLERIYQVCMPYWLMGESGMLPPPPPELQGMPIQITYVGALAQAQKAQAISGIERLIGFFTAPNVAQFLPSGVAKIDGAQAVDEMADLLGVSGKVVLSDEKMAAIEQQRQMQEQGQQMIAAAPAIADVAGAIKDVSEAQVAPGKGALQQGLENLGFAPQAQPEAGAEPAPAR